MTGKSKIFRRAKPADVESVLAKLTSKDPIYGPQSGRGWHSPMKKPVKRTNRRAESTKLGKPIFKPIPTMPRADILCHTAPENCSPSVKAWSSMKMPDATSIRRFKELKFRIMKK